MDKSTRSFVPQLATFGVDHNNRMNTNYMTQHWPSTGFKQRQKAGQGYKKGKFSLKLTGRLGDDLPPVPLNPIHNLINAQVGAGHHYQMPMNSRNKRSTMLYNQHLQADEYFQLPHFSHDKGAGMYTPSLQPTGNPYNKYMKRGTGETRTGQTFHLTGQTPEGLMGLEGSHGNPYAGNFSVSRHAGAFNTNRLQNAINNNRNRYFQQQFLDGMSESMSNRMLQGIQGGHFNGMQDQQQYGVNRHYMNGQRKPPPSFKSRFNQAAHGGPHFPLSGQYSFESMLPNIPGQYREYDDDDDDDTEDSYRYKYNNRSRKESDTADLIGKYAKYYRAQDLQNEQNKEMKAAIAAAVTSSSDKNSELVSRYLKHAAKKQVRSTSISVPKYTGDYDPDVFVTGKLQSNENISDSSLTKGKQHSEEDFNKESLLNKQEAAAEQKFRLEKANFPAPSSLNNAANEENKAEMAAKYKLKYTKRKKMVIASTSDKENDPSMLVKGGGDDVVVNNDEEIPEEVEEQKKVEFEPTEEEPVIIQEEIIEQAVVTAPPPTPKKIIKKLRKPPPPPKLVPEKEVGEKKIDISNKQQPEQKPKVTKTVDIRKQVKKVTIEKVKRTVPTIAAKDIIEEEPASKEEEEPEEDSQLQSIVETVEMPMIENESYHEANSEEELQFPDDEEIDEKLEQQKADEELNAILAPLRAQMPDHIRISPTLGFLPIMPVTFSWFPMSQQHKEAFQKMSEQSKFPKSLRPFQRFAAT